MSDREHAFVAECPLSWCRHTEVEGDEDAAAVSIAEHVNANHSEKDIQTLRNGE